MNKLDLIVQFEAENNVVFPNSYKEILRIFNNYIIYDYHITELGIKKNKRFRVL
ncbi:SMI1/KNR4 family protein [Kingella kingae]|uniref:SMI1/KNR4 family protein n=1 Tax=Kingella kingae TaxID=504 RepID=UPI001E516138|nr:SMI1/KNR4 family protein [Kingella kingae]MDK4531229.1 SMI1/KNR4 family protein [Kingella kingae]MDK4535232.1 SMI1/KNR4 family protein [Kingella kingae]MDK4581314.1 SMI1/KNR4 family protein [Kingella kingae]